jgi:hypothetical protein
MASRTRKQQARGDVSKNDIFDLLSHYRRRLLVHALKSSPSHTEIGELAEQIAAWELGIDREELSSKERKRLYTSIQQQHLPRMAEAGFVEFDPDRGTVKPTAALDEADIYLEMVIGREIPWSEFYIGLSGVFAGLTVVVWLEIWPFHLVPTELWLAVVVLTVGLSAACHRMQNRIMKLGAGERPPEVDAMAPESSDG